MGKVGLAFLNFIPVFGRTYSNFISQIFTDLFNGIYNQKINKNNANRAIVGFFVIVGILTIVISGVTVFNNPEKLNENQLVKKIEQTKKQETKVLKKQKKPEIENKKKTKKLEPKKKGMTQQKYVL